MFSNLEIEPIEDNIEHEDSFDHFDALETLRSINNCDWTFLVIVLLILLFFLVYFWGVELGIFHWKFEDIYYQLSNKRGGANKREELIGFLERALMKAENFKIENLEKLLDEGKDENIDIVKKKFQEAGLY